MSASASGGAEREEARPVHGLSNAVAVADIDALRDFDAVLENIDYGVLVLAANLRVRHGNSHYRSLWGMPEEVLHATPRPSFRDLIDYNRRKGLYAVSDDEWMNWVEDYLRHVAAGGTESREL